MEKPIGLHQALSQEFNNNELANLCADLGIDVEELPPQKSARARELLQYAQRRNKMDKLLGWLAKLRPENNYADYVYLVIVDRFNTAANMRQLSAALGIDYDQELVKNLGYFSSSANPDVILAQAWRIYELMAQKGQAGKLLQVMQQHKPDLNLGAFAALAAQPAPLPVPEPGPGGDGLTYEPFDLRINAGQNGVYEVEVLYSPEGETPKVPVAFPLQDREFTDLLGVLKDLLLSGADAVSLGKKLKPLLFPGAVWSKFVECRTAMKRAGKGLRLRLRIEPPELIALPWEYVHDETYDYLAQDKWTPMVRYQPESTAVSRITAVFPLRILLVTANPKDQFPLKVDKEEALLRQALEPLLATGLAELTVIPKAQIGQVRQALSNGRYHIFHFIGHGLADGAEGALALENETGATRAVTAAQLRALLRNSDVRFVFLNACETAVAPGPDPISGVAQSLARAGIPAVMAMQFEVPDNTALLFTSQLYANLAAGKPLDEAITEMRRAAFIDAQDLVFWGIPVLYLRAPDGIIWQADDAARQKLAAYTPQSPPQKALRRAALAFQSIQSTLDADAINEFTQDLQTVQGWLASNPDDRQKARIRQTLQSMMSLLEIYGIAADDLTMKALKEAMP